MRVSVDTRPVVNLDRADICIKLAKSVAVPRDTVWQKTINARNDGTGEPIARAVRGARGRRPIAANHIAASRRLSASVVGDEDKRAALRHMGTYVQATRLTSMSRFAIRNGTVESHREEGCCRHTFTVITRIMPRPLT